MDPAPLPEREEERLRALRALGVLDTEPDSAFDAIVRVAASVCNTPIAFISLIDEGRQWLKAGHGLDVKETTRELAFCAHAILEPSKVMEVPDAEQDARFFDHPFVVGPPSIRFYAGAPLVDEHGFGLGTLCVLDHVPRELTEAQRAQLRGLSEVVVRLFQADLRRRAQEKVQSALETALQDAAVDLRATLDVIARERAFLSTVLESLEGIAVFVFDDELRIERVLGAPTLARAGMKPVDYEGRKVAEFALPANREPLEIACREALEGQRARVEVGRAGRRFEVNLVPFAVGGDAKRKRGVAVSYDVTDRDIQRTQLATQERLITIGTLAAGVGHEINNPLTYVIANLELVAQELKSLGGEEPSARFVELATSVAEVREGAERIRRIVLGLRAFAREEKVPVPTDVHRALEISINMAMHEIRPRATLTRAFGPTPRVLGDDARLAQVFVNLLVNAGQTFETPAPDEHRVHIVTRTDEHGSAVIEISDDGPGMDEAVAARIFEPFFTTKPVGSGTGLGLAICHSIVTSLGGTIACETAPGRGALFRVTFPPAERSGSR